MSLRGRHFVTAALPRARNCSLYGPRLLASSSPISRRGCFLPSSRLYYTPSAPLPLPYPKRETAILSSALSHVPEIGFTSNALARGAVDAGYLPATAANLFSKGPFELVLFHLVSQRMALRDAVQFPDDRPLGTTAKVRALLLARLHANAALHSRLPDALGLMSLAGNIPASLAELSRLVDEIWYLAGDTSVDSSWYSKRASLAAVYASSEMFMLQDQSVNFTDTDSFVDRRLADARVTGRAIGDVGQWLGFTGVATVNVLRSWGVRI